MRIRGPIGTEDFFKDYLWNNSDGFGEHNRLHVFELRDAPERRIELSDFAQRILDPYDGVKLDPSDIKSIILFGSSVNKTPKQIIQGKRREVKIPLINKTLRWKDPDQSKYIPINDIDVCVITRTPYNHQRIDVMEFYDIPYGARTAPLGTFDLYWISQKQFEKSLRDNMHYVSKIYEEGLPIIDDGYFDNVRDKTSPANYEVLWKRRDVYHGPLDSRPMKKNALEGRLRCIVPPQINSLE